MGRKSDEQMKADSDKALDMSRQACRDMGLANERRKSAQKNSIEYGLAELDACRAWLLVAEANILALPFTNGPEYQLRVDDLEYFTERVKRLEAIVAELKLEGELNENQD